MKLSRFYSVCAFLFVSFLTCNLFAERTTSSSTKKRKNVVEININLKANGSVDVSKESKVLPGDPDKRIITIKDSDTGNPVPEANVNIDKKWDVVTSSEGKADLPDDVDDGNHTMTVTKGDTYVKTESNFTVADGEISTPAQVSIPKTVDYERIKIILDWGETPEDLDSHIISGSRHVYFSNMYSGNLNLDRDDTSSYGPETVTIQDMNPEERYEYYVLDYTNRSYPECTALSNSGAKVRVFMNNDLVATFNIKPNQQGVLWHVFDVVNGNEIVEYDSISGNRM